MTLKELKHRSNRLFNCILGSAAVNLLAFMGSAFYFLKTKESLESKGLKDSDPAAYAEQMNLAKIIAGSGFAIAIIAILACIIFAKRRLNLTKQIITAEQEELEQLEEMGVK